MLLYIRIDERLKGEIDKLVEADKYESFNSAALAALHNLVLAEEETGGRPVSAVKPESKAKPDATRETRAQPSERILSLPPALASPKSLKVPKSLIALFPTDLFQRGQR